MKGRGAAALLVATAIPLLQAQGSDSEVPESIDLSAFPGEIVQQVVIPIPAEIFAVLDKVGDPDWSGGIKHVDTTDLSKDRGILAMSFGCLVAEGFIAVQAESSEDIRQIGMRSLTLADALGLEAAVKSHSMSLIDSAKKNDWLSVRAELDKTQQTVRQAMSQQRDQELSELVSLGGWLRGTNVLTQLIAEDFTSDKAELLNQPDLVRYFRERLTKMDQRLTRVAEIEKVAEGLGRIDALLRDERTLDAATIESLKEITQEILQQFYFEESAE